MKLHAVDYGDGREGLSFRCEGCGGYHTVIVKDPGAWTWNGDTERPVFSPSCLVIGGNAEGETRCYSFVGCNGVQPGEIIFLSDCTHALAGQVRPLPEWSLPP